MHSLRPGKYRLIYWRRIFLLISGIFAMQSAVAQTPIKKGTNAPASLQASAKESETPKASASPGPAANAVPGRTQLAPKKATLPSAANQKPSTGATGSGISANPAAIKATNTTGSPQTGPLRLQARPLPNQQNQTTSPTAAPPADTTAGQATAGAAAAPGSAAAAPAASPMASGKSIKSIRKKKRKETSDSIAKKQGVEGPGYVVGGEAQVLPARILRFRYVLQNISGAKGYDEKGKSYESGASINITGHSFIAEYGITDRLSLQFIVPVTGSSNLGIDAKKFRKTAEYEKQYRLLVEGVAPSLQQGGFCKDYTSCRQLIDNGLALGVDTPFELPTGEVAIVPSKVPIKNVADSLIMKALEPANGKTGLGDITIGLGYNIVTTPKHVFTVGLGLRMPTGDYTDVPIAYRAPGSGFTTLGLLLRYDYRIVNPLVFSIGTQSEYHVINAVRKRSSALNPTQLNSADPTVDNPAIAGKGDGVANNTKIERKGVLNAGSTSLIFALGAWTSYLNAFVTFAALNWEIDPASHQGALSVKDKSESYYGTSGLSINGLSLQPRIPVIFTYSHTTAVAGKNSIVTPDADVYQFIFFYKF